MHGLDIRKKTIETQQQKQNKVTETNRKQNTLTEKKQNCISTSNISHHYKAQAAFSCK